MFHPLETQRINLFVIKPVKVLPFNIEKKITCFIEGDSLFEGTVTFNYLFEANFCQQPWEKVMKMYQRWVDFAVWLGLLSRPQ